MGLPWLRGCASPLGLRGASVYRHPISRKRKVRFSTDRQDVFDLLTTADAASRVKAIAQQYLDADTRIVIWYNMAGGDGVTI